MFKEDLLAKREIYLEEGIDYEMADDVGKLLMWLNAQNNDEITIYINCSGGSVSAALSLYDIIKNSKSPVTGIVFRRANSMAAVVLQACKVRKAMMHCQIALHNLKLYLNEEWDEFEEKAKAQLKDIRENQEKVWRIMSERTNMDLEAIKKLCQEKRILTASEAKEMGFVDFVI